MLFVRFNELIGVHARNRQVLDGLRPIFHLPGHEEVDSARGHWSPLI